MSRYIAASAIRGAQNLVRETEAFYNRALAEKGAEAKVGFPNTAYYLPTVLGLTGRKVETVGDLKPVIEEAKGLLHPIPANSRWTPYLGETLDSGVATLLAEEVLSALRFLYGEQPERLPGFHLTQAGGSFTSPEFSKEDGDGHLNGPIDDIQLRSWGIQLVDGRMPGFAAVVGCAKSNQVAVRIVRELQRRNILIFLSGNVNGRSIIHQLQEEGVEMGYDTYIVPFGTDTVSAIYALGFATRSALTFGGMKGGQAREILLYNKARVFAFVLALGEVDDLKYATAAGAISYGFPVVADTVIPEILPTGVTTYEHVISLPFDEIEAKDDLERAEKLVQKCIEVRGVKIKMTQVPIPVPYGSAFEGEVVRKADLRVEFGGKHSRCFEYLYMLPMEQVEDGKIHVLGPDLDSAPEGLAMDLGIVVEVAGRKMQEDFEPVLERQIHHFINGASGVQHIGQRDIAWIRLSKTAFDKGFRLEHLGKILHARFQADFGAIVDKVQVTIYSNPADVNSMLQVAREAYQKRNVRLADLTDEAVDEFYSCTLCQSFAPNHVCVVSPERLGLCGAYNWLDCKASYQINPTGPNQPISKGLIVDADKGYWQGPNAFVYQNSHQSVEQVSLYSIMENPMTACLTEDAEVLVDGKPTRIGEFVNSHRAETFHTAEALTLGANGQMQADRIVALHKNPAPAQLIRLATKSGGELLLTPNHKVGVDRPEGMTWVHADALRKGDRVLALKQLQVSEQIPDLLDLLPDDLRVPDEALVEDIINRLRAKHGSLAAAYRAANVQPLGPRTRSLSLGDLKPLAVALGDDWQTIKRAIRQVAGPMGNWQDTLPELNSDLFYLLGLIASDGSLSRRGKYECFVNFVNADEGLLRAFAETYARVFPKRPLGRAEKDRVGGTIDGRPIHSSQRAFTLYGANPLMGLIADSFGVKRTGEPRWGLSRLVNLPQDRIAAFLAGSFDGDGSVRVRKHGGKWEAGEAYLCIDDRRAASHLQLLLKRLGIVGHIKASGRVFKVMLNGRDLRRFAEIVRVQHPAKRKLLAQLTSQPRRDLEKSQSEVLPYAAGKALAALPASQAILSPSTLYYYRTARSRPVLSNVQQVLAAQPDAAAALAPFLNTDCFLDTLTRVEEIQNAGKYDHVYNLTLMNIHSYWANQLLVANCGCFECIVMVIPEANGVMVVSREDTSMTPAGMTFSTLAGMAGGGLQTPGVMGVGKYYLTSKKFLSADGGFKRVVWMSSILKQTMQEEMQKAAEYAEEPDLLDKIADETVCTEVPDLVAYLEEKGHPALTMDPIM